MPTMIVPSIFYFTKWCMEDYRCHVHRGCMYRCLNAVQKNEWLFTKTSKCRSNPIGARARAVHHGTSGINGRRVLLAVSWRHSASRHVTSRACAVVESVSRRATRLLTGGTSDLSAGRVNRRINATIAHRTDGSRGQVRLDLHVAATTEADHKPHMFSMLADSLCVSVLYKY